MYIKNRLNSVKFKATGSYQTYGGAAIMWSLALLGGPFGAIAGIGVLIVISKYGNKISEYGIEKVIVLVVKRMEKKGKSKSQIIDEIKKYKIS